MKVNMLDAKSQLSRLVKDALEGEEVVIASNGEPMVRLVPVAKKGRLRRWGKLKRFRTTIDAIDARASSVTVKGVQGRVVTLALQDGKALQSLRVGDTLDVTYYESLLIDVSRPKK